MAAIERRITTDRLLLRPFTSGDLPELADLFAETEFWRYPFGRGRSRQEAEAFLERTIGRYEGSGAEITAATLRSTGDLIGFIGLSVPEFLPEVLPAVEVGWRLGRKWWGQGLATEGARAAIAWGFSNLRVDEVVCIYEPANVRSGRVCDRLGFGSPTPTMHPARSIPLLVRRVGVESWGSQPE